MANEYQVPEKYEKFCKEVVEQINEFYEDNGVVATLLVAYADIYITVKDKSGFYESVTGLIDININRSVNDNVNHIIELAGRNFMNQNFH